MNDYRNQQIANEKSRIELAYRQQGYSEEQAKIAAHQWEQEFKEKQRQFNDTFGEKQRQFNDTFGIPE